jgi:hypothetical protein
MDTLHCMGRLCLVPCSLDCYKTLQFTTYRMDHRGLFRGVNEDTHELLRSVSS